MTPSDPIVELVHVKKNYPLGNVVVRAIDDVSLAIGRGEFTTIAGPSGSGKTTLLNLIGCVDVPTSGLVTLDGARTEEMNDRQLTNLRLHKLGFIFQSFNLIPVLNLYQNVEFPLLLMRSMSKKEREDRVRHMVERVGLIGQIKQRPNELSGGQRQRVAIARALVTRPKIVLADEPTANLDSATGQTIIELMREINQRDHTTFIFSTHDQRVMQHADRIVRIADGRLASDAQSAGQRPADVGSGAGNGGDSSNLLSTNANSAQGT